MAFQHRKVQLLVMLLTQYVTVLESRLFALCTVQMLSAGVRRAL